jgi:hypothetical protein
MNWYVSLFRRNKLSLSNYLIPNYTFNITRFKMKCQICLSFIFLLCTFSFSEEINSGLLIGYSYENDYSFEGLYSGVKVETGYMQKFRTLWIAPVNNNLKIVAEFPEIIVPTDSNFWRINIKRSVYNEQIEDFLLAYPLEIDSEPNNFGIDSDYGENCDGIIELNVDFVGNKYISSSILGAGFCKDSPTDHLYTDISISLINPKKKQNQIWDNNIKNILGDTLYKKFMAEGEIFYNSLSEQNSYKEMINDKPTCLYVVRGQGKWIIKGRFEPSNLAARGAHEDFIFDEIPPQDLVGYDGMDYSWNELKSLFPDIQDAFMSPARDVIGIFRQGKINFHKINQGKIDKNPISIVDLNVDGINFKIIMLQWAVDKYVQRWTKFFKDVNSKSWKYKFKNR